MAKEKELIVRIKAVEDPSVAKATDGLNKLEKQVEKTKTSTDKLGGGIGALPGPLGKAVTGVKTFGTALKALMANPIILFLTLVVGALTGLFKLMTSTKAGAEKLERSMAGLSAMFDVVRDAILNANFSNLGSDLYEDANAAAEATKQLQLLADATRELSVERERQNTLNEEAKLLREDENVSYEDKIQIISETMASEIALAEEEKRIAEEKLAATKTLASLSDSGKETLEEIAKLEADVYKAQKKTYTEQLKLKKQLKAVESQYTKDLEKEYKTREALIDKIADYEFAVKIRGYSSSEKAIAILKRNQNNELLKIDSDLLKQKTELDNKFDLKAANTSIKNTKAIIKTRVKELEYWHGEYREKAEAELETLNTLLENKEEGVKKHNDAIYKLDDDAGKLQKITKIFYIGQIKNIEDNAAAEKKANKQTVQDEETTADANYAAKRTTAINEIHDGEANTQAEIHALELETLDNHYNDLLDKAELYHIDKTELETSFADERKALKLKQEQEIVDGTKRITDEAREARIQEAQTSLSALNDLLNAMMDLNDASSDKTEEGRKKAFERGKKLQIAQVTVDMLSGILSAYATAQTLGPPLGPIIGAMNAAAVGVAGYSAIKKIKGTEFQPSSSSSSSSSSGSKFEQGGLSRGRSHSQGGIRFGNDEIESGEFIINRNSTNAFLPLLEKLNSLGQGTQKDSGNVSGVSEEIGLTPAPIVKAYVISGEITSQQNADKKISDLARL